jgi:hypothetical protein
LLLDTIEEISDIDVTDFHQGLKNIPETIKAAWLAANLKPGGQKLSGILIAGSDRFCDIARLFQNYFRFVSEAPIKIVDGDDAGGSFVSGAENLLVLYSQNEDGIIQQARDLTLKFGVHKAIIISAKLRETIDTGEGKIDTICVPGLVGRPYGIEILFPAFLAIAQQHGFIADHSNEINSLCAGLARLIGKIEVSVPAVKNPAKRLAGQLMERMIVIIGCGFLSMVAKFWKDQFNHTSKTWAQFETIPEIKINALNGIFYPENMLSKSLFVFLSSRLLGQEQMRQMMDTKNYLLSLGVGTDEVTGQGDSILAQTFNLLVFGEFVAYYLAILNAIDPAMEPDFTV